MTSQTLHLKQRPLVVTEDKQQGNVNQKYCDIWPDEKKCWQKSEGLPQLVGMLQDVCQLASQRCKMLASQRPAAADSWVSECQGDGIWMAAGCWT